jgi:thiamine-phosphate pyrophosphorylase
LDLELWVLDWVHVFRLMLVTDRTLVSFERLPDVVEQAIGGGVDAVQLREKDLPAEELTAIGRRLREMTRGRAALVVNGPVAVAQACDADGVHLPETAPLPAESERRRLVVGRSVHDPTAAWAAAEEGCDYVVLGTVFPSRTHPGGATGGPELVSTVAGAVDLPVVAIGGITAENAGDVIRAGAHGVAVISAILAAQDPHAAARTLRRAIDATVGSHAGARR